MIPDSAFVSCVLRRSSPQTQLPKDSNAELPHVPIASVGEAPLQVPQPEGEAKKFSPKIENLVNEITKLNLIEVGELSDLLKKRLNLPDAPLMPVGGFPLVPAAAAAEVSELNHCCCFILFPCYTQGVSLQKVNWAVLAWICLAVVEWLSSILLNRSFSLLLSLIWVTILQWKCNAFWVLKQRTIVWLLNCTWRCPSQVSTRTLAILIWNFYGFTLLFQAISWESTLTFIILWDYMLVCKMYWWMVQHVIFCCPRVWQQFRENSGHQKVHFGIQIHLLVWISLLSHNFKFTIHYSSSHSTVCSLSSWKHH